jgi:hypothetical protein
MRATAAKLRRSRSLAAAKIFNRSCLNFFLEQQAH